MFRRVHRAHAPSETSLPSHRSIYVSLSTKYNKNILPVTNSIRNVAQLNRYLFIVMFSDVANRPSESTDKVCWLVCNYTRCLCFGQLLICTKVGVEAGANQYPTSSAVITKFVKCEAVQIHGLKLLVLSIENRLTAPPVLALNVHSSTPPVIPHVFTNGLPLGRTYSEGWLAILEMLFSTKSNWIRQR